MLLSELKEIDTVELIMAELQVPYVDKGGMLTEKNVGIYQGASFSPVLSNLYLREVDKYFERDGFFYARYADDILMLFCSKVEAAETVESMGAMLSELGLVLNQEKTYIRTIEEGFDFLGYRFDQQGRSIPAKAEEKLQQTLEEIWLTMAGKTLEERLRKGSQVVSGWEQYYREPRQIATIFEYVTVVYMLRYKEELQKIAMLRSKYTNSHRDIARYLADVWKENGLPELAILEYEQLFDVFVDYHEIRDERYQEEVLDLYEKCIRLETEEVWTSLMQAYSALGCYLQAEKMSEKSCEFRRRSLLIHPLSCRITWRIFPLILINVPSNFLMRISLGEKIVTPENT